jgi:hypothetical protein
VKAFSWGNVDSRRELQRHIGPADGQLHWRGGLPRLNGRRRGILAKGPGGDEAGQDDAKREKNTRRTHEMLTPPAPSVILLS